MTKTTLKMLFEYHFEEIFILIFIHYLKSPHIWI